MERAQPPTVDHFPQIYFISISSTRALGIPKRKIVYIFHGVGPACNKHPHNLACRFHCFCTLNQQRSLWVPQGPVPHPDALRQCGRVGDRQRRHGCSPGGLTAHGPAVCRQHDQDCHRKRGELGKTVSVACVCLRVPVCLFAYTPCACVYRGPLASLPPFRVFPAS